MIKNAPLFTDKIETKRKKITEIIMLHIFMFPCH